LSFGLIFALPQSSLEWKTPKFANHLVTRFTFENPEKKIKNQNKMQRERKEENKKGKYPSVQRNLNIQKNMCK
jgi:hypothetical protein